MTTASASAAADSTAELIWQAEVTRTIAAPAGSARPTLAVTTVTAAPLATAASASAYPRRPDDQVPLKRTGSISPRGPPALTTTRRPRRACALPAGPRARTRPPPRPHSAGARRPPGPGAAP